MYDPRAVATELAEAKAAILALGSVPFQREWLSDLQEVELKREVAGTSRIEGADFTDRELDQAMRSEGGKNLLTRSLRQARAAANAYRWIAKLPADMPIDETLILQIHSKIVTGADDDHCAPGKLRGNDQNVSFGYPRHRGVDGGQACMSTFKDFTASVAAEYPNHDPIIQAVAAHYHLAAMHPFLDGNGRTARALEAMMLRRAGLRDICFISMSNYYYDEKAEYLRTLAEVRSLRHDLTPFLKFSLRGIAQRSYRLLEAINLHIRRALFRNMMYDLFGRLRTPRRRVIASRQIEILKLLLGVDEIKLSVLQDRISALYANVRWKNVHLLRDLNGLIALKALDYRKLPDGDFILWVRLSWPTEITETDFLERLRELPKAKTYQFLQ